MTSGASVEPRSLLWVNHFAVSPDMGGPTRHAEMSRALARLGWRVTVAASDFHLHQRRYMRRASADERQPLREPIDGADFAWLWAAPYAANDLRRVANWLTFSRSLLSMPSTDRPSIVIGSTPHLFAALAAHRLARRTGAPFVLEVRDLWPETLQVAGHRRGVGYAGLWAVAQFLYRAASRIIVLAEGTAEYLASRGIPEHKFAFLPNGVDVQRFGDAAPPARNGLRLIYAGAHGPANGLEAVLDAAERLRGDERISFALVGDGPSKQALRADAIARRLSNVEFLDPVPKSDMPQLLARFDAGLMVLKDVPVFSFGVSPNKLFDYWAAALPVVCNVPGEVANIVRAADGGVQTANASGAALADAIRQLMARPPETRRALGCSGRSWVVASRDRAHLATQLDALLRDVLNGHAA